MGDIVRCAEDMGTRNIAKAVDQASDTRHPWIPGDQPMM